MSAFVPRRDANGVLRLSVPLRGRALLGHPMYNKGTAFTVDERRALGLEGLLPGFVSTIELQVRKIHSHIERTCEDPLAEYIGLAGLQDMNEHVFYRLLVENVERYLPVVYTPTVGRACEEYSHIFRRSRGMWITPAHAGRMREVLACAPGADIQLIVVTDGERILGLGDQGAGGMGIPIGKLSLYTVAAGIHPSRTLPICLDFGTDNESLLNDELYLGRKHARIRGEEYDALVEEFVEAVESMFPNALLQWEDFKKANAMRLLERYRRRLLSFNDDIQGTAAVAVAGILAGVRATGRPITKHRVIILGAGAAGIGIDTLLQCTLRDAGLSEAQARGRVAMLDSGGLLTRERTYRETDTYKRDHGWTREHMSDVGIDDAAAGSFESVVTAFHPTILIGTSGQPGAFTEAIVREMASNTDEPLIFPLSNPTSKSEATPADIYEWTDGRAWVATGSPFDPVDVGGKRLEPAQGNNVYIFPGVGLGALAVGASEVTDGMFAASARALAEEITDADFDRGSLYPRLSLLRDLTPRIAHAVAMEAIADGVAPSVEAGALRRTIEEMMWFPEYPEMVAE